MEELSGKTDEEVNALMVRIYNIIITLHDFIFIFFYFFFSMNLVVYELHEPHFREHITIRLYFQKLV